MGVPGRIIPGDRVDLNARWCAISSGVVTDVNELGFRVSQWWFGWHELKRLVCPCAEWTLVGHPSEAYGPSWQAGEPWPREHHPDCPSYKR